MVYLHNLCYNFCTWTPPEKKKKDYSISLLDLHPNTMYAVLLVYNILSFNQPNNK